MLKYCSREYPWAVYCEGPPSFIWGEERGEGQEKIEEHFSQLTKQYYFTAKIMLKYCSGESR